MAKSDIVAQSQAPIPNESDIYDRQIRLWGAEAQVLIRSHAPFCLNLSCAVANLSIPLNF